MVIDKEEVTKYLKEGKSIKDLARDKGKTVKAIQVHIFRNQIKLNEIKDNIYKEYFDKGLNDSQIMILMDKCKSAVWLARKRYHGIKTHYGRLKNPEDRYIKNKGLNAIELNTLLDNISDTSINMISLKGVS